jgi:hypothetical protein
MKSFMMKNLILFVLLFFNALVTPAQDIFSPMEGAIKKGSAAELSRYLNQTVDVTIDDNQSTFDRKAAEAALNDFFKKTPPSGFDIIHTGASKGGLKFAIGRYTSANTHYSVLMRVRDAGNVRLIHEISFVKE